MRMTRMERMHEQKPWGVRNESLDVAHPKRSVAVAVAVGGCGCRCPCIRPIRLMQLVPPFLMPVVHPRTPAPPH